MRKTLYAALLAGTLVTFTAGPLWAQAAADKPDEYDGCGEQFYDSSEEPCGGGHQHQGGKRDEVMLERSRHRHRYLEAQIAALTKKVDALSAEVAKLKGGK